MVGPRLPSPIPASTTGALEDHARAWATSTRQITPWLSDDASGALLCSVTGAGPRPAGLRGSTRRDPLEVPDDWEIDELVAR
jgi:hypothetical protein